MDIINPLLNISISVLSRWLLLAKLPLFTAHEKTSSANLFWAPNRFPEAVPCIKTHFCFISSCWRQAQGEEMQCWGHQQNAAMHHYNTDLWTVVHVTGDMENTQPHTPLQEEQKDPVLQLRHFTQYNWNLGTHILEQHSLTAQQCSVGQPALSTSAPPGAPTALLQGTSTHDKCLKGRKKEKHH